MSQLRRNRKNLSQQFAVLPSVRLVSAMAVALAIVADPDFASAQPRSRRNTAIDQPPNPATSAPPPSRGIQNSPGRGQTISSAAPRGFSQPPVPVASQPFQTDYSFGQPFGGGYAWGFGPTTANRPPNWGEPAIPYGWGPPIAPYWPPPADWNQRPPAPGFGPVIVTEYVQQPVYSNGALAPLPYETLRQPAPDGFVFPDAPPTSAPGRTLQPIPEQPGLRRIVPNGMLVPPQGLESIASPAENTSIPPVPLVGCNLQVLVSENFLNRLIAREDFQPGEVRDFILGADVFGQQETVSKTFVDVVPSAVNSALNIVVEGRGRVKSVGVTPQAAVDTVGRQQFVAVKEVQFDGQLLLTRRAKVDAVATNVPVAAQTALSGRPFLGPIAERIAIGVAQSQRNQAETIASNKVAKEVYDRFNTELDRTLERGNIGLVAAREKLEQARMHPQKSQWFSTTTDVVGQMQIGESENAIALPATVPGDRAASAGIAIQLHESVLGHAVAQSHLGGWKTTDKELRGYVKTLEQQLPGMREIRPETPANLLPLDLETEIEFDRDRPLELKLEDDRLTVTLRATFRPAGQDVVPPVVVTIPYRVRLAGDLAYLEPGVPVVRTVDREFATGANTVMENLIKQSLVSELITIEFSTTIGTIPAAAKSVVVSLRQISAANGWLTIGLD